MTNVMKELEGRVVSDLEEADPDSIEEALEYRYGADQGLDATVEAVRKLGVEAIGVRANLTEPEDVEHLVALAVVGTGRASFPGRDAGQSARHDENC